MSQFRGALYTELIDSLIRHFELLICFDYYLFQRRSASSFFFLLLRRSNERETRFPPRAKRNPIYLNTHRILGHYILYIYTYMYGICLGILTKLVFSQNCTCLSTFVRAAVPHAILIPFGCSLQRPFTASSVISTVLYQLYGNYTFTFFLLRLRKITNCPVYVYLFICIRCNWGLALDDNRLIILIRFFLFLRKFSRPT